MGAVLACCSEEAIDYDNVEVELSHFHLLRSVGKGAFGKVRIVQHKRDKRNYALKYINKAKCIKMRAVENIIQERRLLEEVQHPLVCNLRFAFQDDENLFMVLDLMLGGDLRFHLDRRQNGLPEDVVRFYCAQVAIGLAHLHSKRVVHRDLKPDNILLDELGHAHLTDFNIAVQYNEKRPLTAVAGSMAYMAPEVLRKKGYFASVDWWSLGVVIFELLFGKRPFRGKTNTSLTQAILHDELRFPADVDDRVSPECISAIRGFLTRDVHRRLGADAEGLDGLKAHPWFQSISWDQLASKEAQSPFIPDSKHANFDATHELEELLLEDNPLKVKKRAKPKPGQPAPVLSKEQQAMEERFTVFDFYKPKRRPSLETRSYADLSPIDRAAVVGEETTQGSSSVYTMQVMRQDTSQIEASGISTPRADTPPSDPSAPIQIVSEKPSAPSPNPDEPAGLAAAPLSALPDPTPPPPSAPVDKA